MKRTITFPTAFTVLFLILILAAGLTHIIPAGSYATLSYEKEEHCFVRMEPNGEQHKLPATQETLDSLGISNDIHLFLNGSILRPIAIPNTFQYIKQQPQRIRDVLLAPIEGVYESVDIILFVLIIGGVIGVLNESGAIHAGISALSRITKGREAILIVFVTVLIALGGTTFGLAEETIAFYPILLPVFAAAGYDSLVVLGCIYIGSTVGSMFSTANPFSVVIASNAAGIHFTEGIWYRIVGLAIGSLLTICYLLRYASKGVQCRKVVTVTDSIQPKEILEETFTKRRKISLSLFAFSFVVMVYGVSKLGWWFEEMSALFLVVGIVIGILVRLPEKSIVDSFVAGSADLVGVALIIGVARGINIILEHGNISDTMLYRFSQLVEGMNSKLFAVVMLGIFMVLGMFLSSSSGLATLSIPILAPLADSVGGARTVIISAFLFGQGMIALIAPIGLLLASLEIAKVSYNRWVRFILPLFCMLLFVTVVLLSLQVNGV